MLTDLIAMAIGVASVECDVEIRFLDVELESCDLGCWALEIQEKGILLETVDFWSDSPKEAVLALIHKMIETE